jgi:hypothetical protein
MSKPVFYSTTEQARSAVSKALRVDSGDVPDRICAAEAMTITQKDVDDARDRLGSMLKSITAA